MSKRRRTKLKSKEKMKKISLRMANDSRRLRGRHLRK
jgi:hypothetical protein